MGIAISDAVKKAHSKIHQGLEKTIKRKNKMQEVWEQEKEI